MNIEKPKITDEQNREKAASLFEDGWGYFNQGRYGKAAGCFTEAINLDDDKIERFCNYKARAWAYVYKGDYEKAVTNLSELVNLEKYLHFQWWLDFRSRRRTAEAARGLNKAGYFATCRLGAIFRPKGGSVTLFFGDYPTFRKQWPKSVNEAADRLITELSEKVKAHIKRYSKQRFLREYSFSNLQWYVQAQFGLLDNNDLQQSCGCGIGYDEEGDNEAICRSLYEMSLVVLAAVWDVLHGLKPNDGNLPAVDVKWPINYSEILLPDSI